MMKIKIERKRFMNPSLIDRWDLFNFKRRKQEKAIGVFLINYFGKIDKNAIVYGYEYIWQEMRFIINYVDNNNLRRKHYFNIEDAIDLYQK